jgi:hypothetical protein
MTLAIHVLIFTTKLSHRYYVSGGMKEKERGRKLEKEKEKEKEKELVTKTTTTTSRIHNIKKCCRSNLFFSHVTKVNFHLSSKRTRY